MDIFKVDQYLMDLMQRYEDHEATEEEIGFLKNIHDDLIDLLGKEKLGQV